MTKSDADRIEELESKVDALQQLLLSLLVAIDKRDPAIISRTREVAVSQVRALADQRRHLASIRLDALLDEVEEFGR